MNGETTIKQEPFNVEFNYEGKTMKITLVNGEDLLKIAEVLSSLLTANGIQNKLEVI